MPNLLDWYSMTGPGALNALAKNTANSLMSGEEPAYRYNMLPLGEDEAGNASLAWPQLALPARDVVNATPGFVGNALASFLPFTYDGQDGAPVGEKPVAGFNPRGGMGGQAPAPHLDTPPMITGLMDDYNSVDAWARGARDEDGNALQPNKLAGINLGGLLPLGGTAASAAGAAADTGSLGVFAGRRAASNLSAKGITGPDEALAIAERMKAEGRSASEIYKATSDHLSHSPYAGVHYGYDGKPRFEISDAPSGEVQYHVPNDYDAGHWASMPTTDGLQINPGDPKRKLFSRKPYWDIDQTGIDGPFVSHPELAKAYPEFNKLDLEIESGHHVRATSGGLYKNDLNVKSPLEYSTSSHDYQFPSKNIKSSMAHELDHRAADAEAFSAGGGPDLMRGHPLYSKPPAQDRWYKPEHNLYERLAGETQARNTADRINFSAEQRRQTPPWLTQDQSFIDQIERPTIAQAILNPMLPDFAKLGRSAALKDRYGNPNSNGVQLNREMPTPPKDQRPLEPWRTKSAYEKTQDEAVRHPNFPDKKPRMYETSNSVVMIDGRAATVDDFKSDWVRQGGLEDMAVGKIRPDDPETTIESYMAGHGNMMRHKAKQGPVVREMGDDYNESMFELTSLYQQGRLKIVPRDVYHGVYERGASTAPELKGLPKPSSLFSNPDEALTAPLALNALQQQSPEDTDSLLDRLLKGYANQ